jgi:hypothetical protein
VAKNRTKKKQSTKAAREIRIFLASSGELAEDRDGIDLYLRQLNDEYGLRQIYLKVVRWENLTTAVSSSRLQDEYNEEVMQADILLCLFSTKAGPGTVEEFEIGLSSAKATGRPAIYTYFKEEKILPSLAKKEELSSLWAFQSRLTELGHFWNPYPDLAHLKLSLRAQLELWIKKSL